MSNPEYSSKFVFYSSDQSIRAIMIRLAFAMRGQPLNGRPDMNWHEHPVTLTDRQPDQLGEQFLCHVNSKGEVPVLANDTLFQAPMSGTTNITWYLCEWYPNLLPSQYEHSIKDLIQELHKIDFSALTFGSQATLPTDIRYKAEEILRRNNISDTYKKALEDKCRLSDPLLSSKTPANNPRRLSQWQNSLTPQAVEDAEQLSRNCFAQIEHLKEEHGSEHIFGQQPTALDAHVLAILGRFNAVGQNDLVPQSLQDWALRFAERPIWTRNVNGSTMPA